MIVGLSFTTDTYKSQLKLYRKSSFFPDAPVSSLRKGMHVKLELSPHGSTLQL